MTFLPIVERELRVATRRRATYWSRIIAALVAVGLTAWMVETLGVRVAPELLGARLFWAVTNLAFFFCLFPGVVLTADCLSEEKREGTLGLLFLTDLKGYDVVLGKLFGTSLGAFYALLAIVPVLALPLVLGGLTAGEFWRLSIVLANTMLFSVAAGLFVSAISWRAQRAMMGTASLVIATAYFLPLAGSLQYLSPRVAFNLAFDARFSLSPAAFYESIWSGHALSWGLLLLASWLAPRMWQRENPPALETGLALPRRYLGSSGVRSPVGSRNPADWLAARGSQQVWIWATLLLVLAAWGLGTLTRVRWSIPLAAVIGAFLFHLALQFWIAFEAARRFNADRRNGALEMLLSTPLAVEDIVRGQIQSLTRQFTRPIYAVLAMDAFLIVLSALEHNWRTGDFSSFLTVMLATMGAFIVSGLGLAWLGLWLGLKTRRSERGALSALVRIVVLPTGIFLFVIYLFFLSGGGGLDGPTGAAVLWFMIGGANAYLFIEHARQQLHTGFRAMAAGEEEPRANRDAVTQTPTDLTGDYALLK